MTDDNNGGMSRREFARLGTAAALSAAAWSLHTPAYARTRPQPAGIQLGVESSPNPTDDDLKFLSQVGFDSVYVPAEKLYSVEELVAMRERYASAGIRLDNVRWFSGTGGGGSRHVVNILLNLPGRDESLEQCKLWLRNYGKAGFGYNIATLSITGVWSSKSMWRRSGSNEKSGSSRGAFTREFDEHSPDLVNGRNGAKELIYGREYGEEEILDNYKRYFIKELVPVAEEAGVCIGFHPDDPPTYKSFGGVARINGTFAQIKRNVDLAKSPNIGCVLCNGVWLEGADKMGMDAADAVRHFVPTGKVWEINFRNVSAPLPKFSESYLDNGYYDMYKIMKALVETGYRGIVHQDHTLGMVGAPNTYAAFNAGYMRALLQRAQREVGEKKGKT